MPRGTPRERSVFGGVLRRDASRVLAGSPGALSKPMDEQTISGDRRLLSNFEKVVGRRAARRLANASRRESSTLDHDDRVRVRKPHLFPFATVCALRSFFPSPQLGGAPVAGTGVLIGPRIVLTAGHNVFDQDYGGAVERVEIHFGLNGDFNDTNVRSVVAEKWATTKGWADNGIDIFDYGALILPTDLGNQLGWMAVQLRAEGDLKGLAVNNAGYPIGWPRQAQDEGYQPEEATTMWFDYGNVIRVEEFTIYYTEIFTAGGSSGSPIFAFLDGQDDPYRVVGVHNYGGSVANSATRINGVVFDDIKFWREESESLKPEA
ncbi:MAG: trypsin-like peptidase domain-containing protein [Gemmataceae bacterium]|nr:trypsin-like peptidase domain-containing protein [Gemmataceae bacterium]